MKKLIFLSGFLLFTVLSNGIFTKCEVEEPKPKEMLEIVHV